MPNKLPNEIKIENRQSGVAGHWWQHDWFALVSLAVFTAFFFFRTVFQGKPISKLCRLANWDSVFQEHANSSVGSCDPSLVQLLLPNYFFAAASWHAGHIPLWNPYSGCGMPFIGDIQSGVFGPVRFLLALSPTTQTYNVLLVGEVALCAIGTYLLARQLDLSRYAAVFAALTFAFCPFVLYYLELLSGTSQALLPLLLASYVWAGRSRTVLSTMACTLATASFVLSGHPESSFFGVLAGVLVYFVVGFREKAARHALFINICVIAVLSLALSAPALLPFVEFMQHGDSYKYGEARPAFAPWPGLVWNLLSPCYGPASPFLGVVAVVLAPLAWFAPRRLKATAALAAGLALASICLVGRIGFIDAILTIKPLFYIITVYLIPLFLLSISLLAATGLEVVVTTVTAKVATAGDGVAFKKLMRVACVAALFACVPLAAWVAHVDLTPFNFDQTLAAMKFDFRAVVVNTVLLVLFMVALLIVWRKNIVDGAKFGRYLFVFACVLNLASAAFIARTSLPVQPFFNFPRAELLDFLKEHPGRALSITEHVLKPNANIVYGVSSMRVHNPMQPLGFADYAKMCGATLDDFRNQTYHSLTDKINLGSVKYIVSQSKPLAAPFKLVHTTGEGIAVYENVEALPEAYFVSNIEYADNKRALDLVAAPEFDGKNSVVLESAVASNKESARSGAGAPANEPGPTSVSFKRLSDHELQVQCKNAVPGCLVVTDTYYPGWKAIVDGREQPILRANTLFRGVLLPGGEHSVRFVYQPLSFVYGAWAAAVALVIIALMTFFALVRIGFMSRSDVAAVTSAADSTPAEIAQGSEP